MINHLPAVSSLPKTSDKFTRPYQRLHQPCMLTVLWKCKVKMRRKSRLQRAEVQNKNITQHSSLGFVPRCSLSTVCTSVRSKWETHWNGSSTNVANRKKKLKNDMVFIHRTYFFSVQKWNLNKLKYPQRMWWLHMVLSPV